MEIKRLEKITLEDIKSFGLNGFRTKKILKVDKNEAAPYFNCSVSEVILDNVFIKEWSLDESTFKYYNDIISQGMSYGAYEEGALVGYILMSEVSWNKSLSIDYLMVSDAYKGKGIGKRLIGKAKKLGQDNYRVLVLEVQNENYGAILFYKKQGFTIEGVEFSRYAEKENEQNVAFMMKYQLDNN